MHLKKYTDRIATSEQAMIGGAMTPSKIYQKGYAPGKAGVWLRPFPSLLKLSIPFIGLIMTHCGDFDPPAEMDPSAKRTVEQGILVGGKHLYNSHVWYGIPYGAPPLGDRRWQPPASPSPWDGVRNAYEKAAQCTQYAGTLGVANLEPGTQFGSEDCLFLNVHAPRFPAEAVPDGKDRLPVMVWIHGGGNSQGSGGDYHGGNLAATHNLIVVTVNYRLGPFGWFYHPALQVDSKPGTNSGNFAIEDLIAALRWIKKNIHAFGGDPNRITVFGESAGGNNAFSLLLSPKAKGLFQAAVMQSAIPRFRSIDQASLPVDRGGVENNSADILEKLLIAEGRATKENVTNVVRAMSNKEIAKFLRGLGSNRIMDAYRDNLNGENPEEAYFPFPTSIQDGTLLPKGSLDRMVRAGGPVASVPVIAGGNRDEQKLYLAVDDDFTSRRMFNLSISIHEPVLYEATARHLSDAWRVKGVHDPLRAIRSVNRNVYAYRFDWDEEPVVLGNDLGKILGAAHAFEIPFVFGHFRLGPADKYMFSDENRDGRLEVSGAMMSYWAGFAYTGNPGRGIQDDLPRWAPFDANATTMVFDTSADGGIRPGAEQLSRAIVLKNVADDPTLNERDFRCRVYSYMAERNRLITDSDLPSLGCAR
jgi:para-nitrobenzyl esterase